MFWADLVSMATQKLPYTYNEQNVEDMIAPFFIRIWSKLAGNEDRKNLGHVHFISSRIGIFSSELLAPKC